MVTKAKMWAAAIGATLTALTSALAAVTLALGDDRVDVAEVGTLATAAVTLGATVYAVWRAPYLSNSDGTEASRHGKM